MADPKKSPQKLQKFDVARLQSMQEPLTIRVDRLQGSARSNVPLPSRDGLPPGAGWDISAALDIERYILEEISGGGVYEISITDAAGESMSWPSFWDPKTYPVKVPSTLAAGASIPMPMPMAAPQMQQPQMQMAPFQPMQPGWPPPGGQYAGPVAPPYTGPIGGYPTVVAGNGYMAPNPYGYGYPQPAPMPMPTQTPFQNRFGYQPAPYAPGENSEVNALRAEVQREREERSALAHKADMERIQQSHAAQLAEAQRQHAAQMQALQQQIAALSTSRQSSESDRVRELEAQRDRDREEARWTALMEEMRASRQPAEDPRIRSLEETIKAQAEQNRLDRERNEAAQRERDLRADMRASEEKTARLIEAANANRPDPIVAMMQENSRNQQESSRQLLQLQQTQLSALQQQQVQPLQLFQMMREASSGTDSVLKSAVNVYNDLFGTARQMFDHMTKMVGGEPEHPAIRIAESVGTSIKELAGKYISGQNAKEVQESKAKQEQARAYVQYIAAQQTQQAAAAGIPQPASTAQPAGELNGAKAAGPTPAAVTPTAAAVPSAPAEKAERTDDAGAKVIQLRRHGKTDREWFGDALDDVGKLRAAAQSFLDGLAKGKREGAGPEEAVQFIALGINQAAAMNLDIKAFSVLFQQERYADFMDVLLPDATQAYRDECAKLLAEMVGDGEDDDDEVDGDGEDEQDADADSGS